MGDRPTCWQKKDRFLPLLYSLIGLAIQLASVSSTSWLSVSHFLSHQCRPHPVHSSGGDPAKESVIDCTGQHYRWEKVAVTGLWTICYSFPYRPDHTDRYCADFADDVISAPWLRILQTLALLSPSLNLLGLLFLIPGRLPYRTPGETVGWLGSTLLTTSGACGVTANALTHLVITQEFVSNAEPVFVSLSQDWAFHSYLYGSMLTAFASTCVVEPPKRIKIV